MPSTASTGGEDNADLPDPQQSLWVGQIHVRRTAFELTADPFELPVGITLLAGPNGAGKTTLLDAISGNFRGASPELLRGGHPMPYRRIGYMPQNPELPSDLTCAELLEHVAWLCGAARRDAREAARRELQVVDLVPKAETPVKELSGGMRRRLAFASVTVRRVAALLLDEPTNDLDPEQRINFLEAVREVGGQVPVLISTHALHDFAGLPDRVIVIDDGKPAYSGPASQFISEFAPASGDLEDAYIHCLRTAQEHTA